MKWGILDQGKGPPQSGGHPGGWFFEDKSNNWSDESSSIHGLAHKIIRYWEVNSLPMKDVFYEIAQQICGKVGKPYCYDMDNPSEVPSRPRKSSGGFGWADVRNGALNLGKWVLKGRKFATQEEANSRAERCVSCPNNIPVEACLPCKFKQAAIQMTEGIVHDLKTPFDSQLKTCDVCKCSCKVLVHVYDVSYMNEEIASDQMVRYKNVNCWKVK